MSKSGIFWIFYGQFTTVLRTLTSLTSVNFVTRPLWGYYPPQSNKKQPLGPLLCQRPGTNPSTARPRPHNTKLEPQPALEVNEVKPATAFGCRSIITAALYWQMALVTSQTQFKKSRPRCRSEVCTCNVTSDRYPTECPLDGLFRTVFEKL